MVVAAFEMKSPEACLGTEAPHRALILKPWGLNDSGAQPVRRPVLALTVDRINTSLAHPVRVRQPWGMNGPGPGLS